MEPMELPGLERLMEVCGRLGLRLETSRPAHSPLQAGARVEGLPLDPMLAAVYARMGSASFATDISGIVLHPWEDTNRQLAEQNRWWAENYQKQFPAQTFVFAGEPHLAYHYATVPSLADERGYQPVVWVDVYEEPCAFPIASNVDRFFEAYSRYLETLMSLPNAREEGSSLLAFPLGCADVIGCDATLVAQLRSGRFDLLMTGPEEQAWERKVIATGLSRA